MKIHLHEPKTGACPICKVVGTYYIAVPGLHDPICHACDAKRDALLGESGFEKFLDAYIECALWSTTDNADDTGGAPLDDNYDESDIADDTRKQMLEDCAAFWDVTSERIAGREERAGHDFWLTRNRHGAGFWDGDWEQKLGAALTKIAHEAGSYDLYVSDGKVHGS